MADFTETLLHEKYSNIESKIPSIWETYEKAGIELAQDIYKTWNISDPELIRVISLLEIKVKGLKISQHIHLMYSFAGLYPIIQKSYDIMPDVIKK